MLTSGSIARARRAQGRGGLARTWTLEHGGRVAWLEERYVVSAARGSGIGRRLLREAIDISHAEGSVATDPDRDVYASRLAEALELRPMLAGRLLNTDDRVVKMLAFRAIELVRDRSAKPEG